MGYWRDMIMLCVGALVCVLLAGMFGRMYRSDESKSQTGTAAMDYILAVLLLVGSVWATFDAGIDALQQDWVAMLLFVLLTTSSIVVGYCLNLKAKLRIISLGLVMLGALALLMGLIPLLVQLAGFQLPLIHI
ncbi:MAG TPA: hypothetical protein VLA88_02590 [Candidatus Saccharimonadales bacterium]|nr:hypothetical protein [Candidatus Saccharimonadales bacterium]